MMMMMMMNDEGWILKDDDFKVLRGFADWQTNRRTFVNVESLSRLKITDIWEIEGDQEKIYCAEKSLPLSYLYVIIIV